MAAHPDPEALAVPLNEKQQRFVAAYLAEPNAAAAYVAAGYKARGELAEAAASRLLSDARVSAAIAAARADREKRTGVTADGVVTRLWAEANDFENGTAASRVAALDKLARHLGLYEADNRQKAAASDPEAAKQRLKARGIDVDKLFPMPPPPSTN